MGKIGIIIQREFNERVRKRSFIITTLLTPLLFIGLMVAMPLLAMMKSSDVKNIIVVDRSPQSVGSMLEDTPTLRFEQTDNSFEQIKEAVAAGEYDNDIFGILTIGPDVMTNPRSVNLYTYRSSTVEIESGISSAIANVVEDEKLKDYDIENLAQILDEVKTHITIQAYRVDESGNEKESSSNLYMILAYIFGFVIYMFVFIYGNMVMNGVIEEKRSKVLEIMVSSVKPFQLMLGKITGIALVAITQFLIWLVVIFVAGQAIMYFFAGNMAEAATAMNDTGMAMEGMDPEALAAVKNLTDSTFLFKVIGGFLLYFIGGYLLYASMFAAIGSAVDNETDTQQLQLPITIPMILSILVLMNVMRDPNGPLAFWFSMIPLTSPVIMVARIPYGVPAWELILSLAILYGSFLFMVWLAGKIYRVGIFMSGKKPTFKEIIKWSRYKY